MTPDNGSIVLSGIFLALIGFATMGFVECSGVASRGMTIAFNIGLTLVALPVLRLLLWFLTN